MTAQIALLRAVNLGPSRRVAMADLRAIAERLGFAGVKTILTSGNVVYRTSMSAARAEAALERALADDLGMTTEVMVRTAAEWRDVIARNPFPTHARKDPARLHVMACKSAPGAVTAAGVKRETYKVIEREIYLFYPDGVGDSKLKLSARARCGTGIPS